jgi:hypothetical protein
MILTSPPSVGSVCVLSPRPCASVGGPFVALWATDRGLRTSLRNSDQDYFFFAVWSSTTASAAPFWMTSIACLQSAFAL